MDKDLIKNFMKKSNLNKAEYFLYNENRNLPQKYEYTFNYKKLEIPNFKDYVILNFETTGIAFEKDKIIKICAVKVIDNNITKTFKTFVNPCMTLPPFISKKINITDDILKDKPKIEDIFENFINFLGNYPLIIYNSKFNIQFLFVNAQNLNITIHNPIMEINNTAKILFPEIKKYNLKSLCKYFSIKNNIYTDKTMYNIISIYNIYIFLYKTYTK